ncbi:MAG: hypothetical protein ACYS76_16640 [Planctomycetota bacterium]
MVKWRDTSDEIRSMANHQPSTIANHLLAVTGYKLTLITGSY